MTAKLYGLGIGPGDPDLITLKALRILQRVAVVAYPAPEEGESLARRIVAPHMPENCIEFPIRMPLVEARFPAQEVYDRAAVELGDHLEAGREVAVLCEGDPFFYGSFMYLFGRMAARYPVEVVPGVSSLTASAAMLGAPLAARNDVLTVVPGTLSREELRARLGQVEAAAIIKVGRHLGKLRQLLDELGLLECAHYIEHATMENQKALLLADVTAEKAPYFSIILLHRRGAAWT
jgi:precorrin-2/cobalt-factor-2 C20-methyltransferase